MSEKQIIAKWKDELLAPNQADVLVNIVPEKNALPLTSYDFTKNHSIELTSSRLLKKILKKHNETQRESGVRTLGVSNYIISFELNGNKYNAPIFITSSNATVHRIKKTVSIYSLDDPFFNPFLSKLLGVEIQRLEIELVRETLNKIGLTYSIDDGVYLANFHPHRFILLKEIEELLTKPSVGAPLKELLSGEKAENVNIKLHEGNLYSTDKDQAEVFDAVLANHIVVQGPPGTGKSQVIANLIGKALGEKQYTLLVAEKQVALSVIFEQLKTRQLHHFCLPHHHQLKAKDFVLSLKNSWEFLEQVTANETAFYPYSSLLEKQLSQLLERLSQADLIGGVSFATFNSKWKKIETKSNLSLADLPSIPQWEKDKLKLEKLAELTSFDDASAWLSLKLPTTIKNLEILEKELEKVLAILEKLDAENWTTQQLHYNMSQSAICSYFFYQDELLPKDLFRQNSKTQQVFFELYTAFQEKSELLALLVDEKKNWKKEFNLTELLAYVDALSSTNRFNIREWYKRKELLRFSKVKMINAKKAIDHLVEVKKLERSLVEIKSKLRAIGLPVAVFDLSQIAYMLRKINQYDKNKIKQIATLNNDQIVALKEQGKELNTVYSFLKSNVLIENEVKIVGFLNEIKTAFPFVVKSYSTLTSISQESKQAIQKTKSIALAEEQIYQGHWQVFQGLFPQLAALSGDEIKSRIKKIITQEKQEQKEYALLLIQQLKTQFESYHQLLQTPARKLTEKEKTFKKTLRKGKSILVKSFAKSRNHLTAKELLLSEAAPWIRLLKPIVLGSPYSVAKSIPFEKQFFDLVIFDEASQVPLPHALGSIYRSKCVVVAGDSQQMAPNFYFKTKASQSVDLLHQAQYYWKNKFLKHHYRSEHPHLIAFSNRYFYENELQTFPAFQATKPVEVITTEGRYVDRKNEMEAKCVAKIITEKIENKDMKFGVVAFSQSQLNCIIDQLSPKIKDQLLDDDEQNILLQSLENVQGEQCDHLIISLGYAKNEEDKFAMRFGPLNQEHGHRRLNVLMSRARKKITFIRSVTATDFTISDNEGVDLLRKLMLLLDSLDAYELNFPFNLKPRIEENTLVLKNVHEKINDARKLITLTTVLEQRGWNVQFDH